MRQLQHFFNPLGKDSDSSEYNYLIIITTSIKMKTETNKKTINNAVGMNMMNQRDTIQVCVCVWCLAQLCLVSGLTLLRERDIQSQIVCGV